MKVGGDIGSHELCRQLGDKNILVPSVFGQFTLCPSQVQSSGWESGAGWSWGKMMMSPCTCGSTHDCGCVVDGSGTVAAL